MLKQGGHALGITICLSRFTLNSLTKQFAVTAAANAKCHSSHAKIAPFIVKNAGLLIDLRETTRKNSPLIKSFIPCALRKLSTKIVFDYNSSWYLLFFGFLASWALSLIIRRNGAEREAKEQVFLGLSGMFALGLIEFFAGPTNLWHCTPGEWPVILWPTYFAATLFGYQLLRSVEGELLFRPIKRISLAFTKLNIRAVKKNNHRKTKLLTLKP